MATIDEVRRENLRRLFRQHGGASALSRKLGYNTPSFMTQCAGPNPTRAVTSKNARRYEEALKLPHGWLDQPHTDEDELQPPKPSAPPAGVDAGVIADVIRLVGQVLQEEQIGLTPARFADVAALAVQDTLDHGGKMREPHIRGVVRLLKN